MEHTILRKNQLTVCNKSPEICKSFDHACLTMVMQRRELKYILTRSQLAYLKIALKGFMEVDQYGKTSIASLYFDTPDYRLVRTSLERPEYKEKIRLRSYGLANKDSTVYLELKRKVTGLVYKRRISIKEEKVDYLNDGEVSVGDNQISREISYFCSYYQNLSPAFLIVYDRTAYVDRNSDLRLTIDESPRYRVDNLNLHTCLEGEKLLDNGGAILEIKVQQAIPLWLARILSEGKIYQSSFSKVGEAYKKEMQKALERKN